MDEDQRTDRFAAFVRQFRSDLFRTAVGMFAGDTHRAEDLVQLCLTKVYLHWHRIDHERGTIAYAHRVLANCFIDLTRRSWWQRERTSDHLPDIPNMIEDTPTDHGAVYAALAELPPRMRAVIVLRFLNGLDVARTAEALRCSQGTVKSQTARGLERLRSLLRTSPTEKESTTP